MLATKRILCVLCLAVFGVSCGGGGGGSPPAAVDPPPTNQAPTANAGADQSVDEGTTANLSATGADGDGTIVSYSWQQESGIAVTITNANMANASFVAPMVAASEVLLFRITVTDDDGATGSDTITVTVDDIGPLTVTVDAGIKQLNFSWTELPGATHYRLLENPDGHSGFTQVGADIPAGTLSVSLDISVHMFDFVNALFIVEGCDVSGCTSSSEVSVMNDMLATIGYFKASNNDESDHFGGAIALSADGTTMAVGVADEQSIATGINGDQSDNSAGSSGAVYVFRYDGMAWFQQAYVKASNTDAADSFGKGIALSADGNTLVVGAHVEDSNATGINGDQDDNSAGGSGAAYVFRYDGTDWFQQAYIKASNSEAGDNLGAPIALSADGNTLAVGANSEDSNATGINGDQTDNSADFSGAAYVFRFNGTNWAQTAYIKASNTEAFDAFGESIALSADGATLVVGAIGESSNATGINGNQTDNSAEGSGAVYVFRFDGTNWAQTAYIKASNTEAFDGFGGFLRRFALSGDGNTLAVGANGEDSSATGINGDQNDNSAEGSGAVYVFRYDGTDWFQQAYVKASNTESGDGFGEHVALSTDATVLAASAREPSCAAGVGGDQNDNSCSQAGAVYVFRFDGTDWAQTAYVKASNAEGGTIAGACFGICGDAFGESIALSADGTTLAVGADGEQSSATGISGDQSDNSADFAGAAYVY